jgi:hypothetical protein
MSGDGACLFEIVNPVNRLETRNVDAVLFALTVIAGRLGKQWQLSRAATKVAETPYDIAVSMVLDRIDDRRLAMLDAFKNTRVLPAKESFNEICEIENACARALSLADPIGVSG